MSVVVRPEMRAIAACSIDPLDTQTCERYVKWLIGEAEETRAKDFTGLKWALAYCDDGVTWGRYDEVARSWFLGNQVLPEVSPPIRRETTLQEVRIFEELAEVLIWRTEEGFQGRMLRETEPAMERLDESNPLRPSDEVRILRGDEVRASYDLGFSHLLDKSGAEQVVPLILCDDQLKKRAARLHVRHYYQQIEDSGAVRVSATRLVKLALEEK